MEDDGIEREAMEDSTVTTTPTKEPEAVEKADEGDGGGILDNLVSNLTSPRASNPIDVDFFDASDVEHQIENLQDHPGGASGVIDNIVSHLPDLSIPENAEPSSDEASLLIHSIIHD